MPPRADLRFLGAPVDDPVLTAAFIDGLIMTPRQKAAALRDYLIESNIPANEGIRQAAQNYIEFL